MNTRILALAVTIAVSLLVVPANSFAQFGKGVKVDIQSRVATDIVHPGSTVRAAFEVKLDKGYHVNSNAPLEDYLIPTKLTIDPPEGVDVVEIIYPEAILVKAGGLTEPLAVFEEDFVIGVTLKLDDDVPEGLLALPVQLRYQACDEKQCYAPSKLNSAITFEVASSNQPATPQYVELFDSIAFGRGEPAAPRTESADLAPISAQEKPAASTGEKDVLALLDGFNILATTGGYLGKDAFLDFIDRAETGRAEKGLFEGRGPLAILLLITIGGLALNLTPCVLPMIPINMAIIGAGAQAGSRVRGFLLGGTYGLAMAFVYGVLGLIVILTAGTFGTINSSPWFNAGIALLFVVLALGMFDVIPIDFSKFQSKLNLGNKGKGTFALAFTMGAVAALLAGACVAPVVIQVIVFSSDLYAKGSTLALALPFFLGIGMAIPWPIAGAGLSFLPKPGPWMVRVKQAFGVFIFAFAAYYGYQSYELFADRMVDGTEVAGSVEEMLEEGWTPSLAQGLTMAKSEQKLVLVDMWATWCKNCLTMDRTTFKNEEVLAALDDYVKVKFQAEDPAASPVAEIMKRFKGIGLPTYAILQPASGAK